MFLDLSGYPRRVHPGPAGIRVGNKRSNSDLYRTEFSIVGMGRTRNQGERLSLVCDASRGLATVYRPDTYSAVSQVHGREPQRRSRMVAAIVVSDICNSSTQTSALFVSGDGNDASLHCSGLRPLQVTGVIRHRRPGTEMSLLVCVMLLL